MAGRIRPLPVSSWMRTWHQYDAGMRVTDGLWIKAVINGLQNGVRAYRGAQHRRHGVTRMLMSGRRIQTAAGGLIKWTY